MADFGDFGLSRSSHSRLIVLSVSAVFFFSIFGCSPMKYKPESISLLATAPMEGTSISSYLTMDTIYKSDHNIVILSHWERVGETQGHTITFEILSDKDEKLLSFSEENFTIHPHMYVYFPVSINAIRKSDELPGQLKINFYVDHQLEMVKNIRYENKELSNKDTQRIVILPFIEYSKSPSPWDESRKNIFRNTIADAFYCEVARIFPDAVPHYVAEQKLGKVISQECFNSLGCMRDLTRVFGEGIFIFGEIYIQKTYGDASSLTVYVYNSVTNKFREFHFFQSIGGTYAALMHDMLYGVLYGEGLVDYLVKR